MTIFGVPWSELQLEHLRRFLAAADPEALLWEAKGVDVRPEEVRRQVCAFANSHEGGYLIIGVSQGDGNSWSLDGINFRDEPPIWVANIVGNGGVNPYPDGLDTRAFPTTDGRSVAVIRVPPISTPPCNTYGTVYERVSGRTIPVREPLRLAQLFARGDQARKAGEENARLAAREILIAGRLHPRHSPERPQFGLGLAAAGYSPDIGSRLFSPRFEHNVVAAIRRLHVGPTLPNGPTIERDVTQDALMFTLVAHDRPPSQSWLVRATWHGAVGVYWVQPIDNADIATMISSPVREAWEAAEEIVALLGPQGPRFLQLTVAGGRFRGNPEVFGDAVLDTPPTIVGRGPLAPGVHTSVLESMARELRRASGEMAYEP